MNDNERFILVSGLILDLDLGVVTAPDSTPIELRPKTVALLRALAKRPGAIVSKNMLIEEVWGGCAIDDDGLVQCVGEIRRALGPSGREALRTHARRGYSLHPDPAPSDVAAPPVGTASRSMKPAIVLGLVAAALAAIAVTATQWVPQTAVAVASTAPPYERIGPTVSVLPFTALSEGDRSALLARALTQDVISDLARNGWVHVLGEATSRVLAASDPLTSAQRLGVDYFASGSIQIESDHARVSAALTDASTGLQLWSMRFEGSAADLLQMQLSASEAIVGELAARWSGPIGSAEVAKARGRGVTDLTAYELILAAGERIDGYAQEDIVVAIDLAKRAVEQAPEFGDAWAKLSLWSYNLVAPGMSLSEIEALWTQGDAAAMEAYRVSPDSPMAITQAANIMRRDDPAKAERMIRRAAELAPNDADILAYLSFRSAHLPALGPEAVRWSDRAVALNPNAPDWYHWNRGAALMVVDRFAEAAEAYDNAPDHIETRGGRIAALALAGDVGLARTLMADLLRDEPSFTADWYADAAGLHPDVAAIYARGFDLARVEEP